MKSFFEFLKGYIKLRIKGAVLLCVFGAVFASVFLLYNLKTDAVWYAIEICLFIGIFYFVVDFIFQYRRHLSLQRMKKQITLGLEHMPVPGDVFEKDYQELLDRKTPTCCWNCSGSNNMWIWSLIIFAWSICRPTLIWRNIIWRILFGRRYANTPGCLSKRRLRWISSHAVAWSFVIEQILSNALKYTKEGCVSIYLDAILSKTLIIEDTGIGIQPSDLPRVFERGFTGYNGRTDKSASGIGMYLCKKVLTMLSHSISLESAVNSGTKVKITMGTEKIRPE